jgi:hypothetical protein
VAKGQGRHESFALSTVQSDSIVQKMIGGKIPEKGLPLWMGEILAFVLQKLGPTGVHFARYSIDYHILRNYLHVVDVWGEDAAADFMPTYAKEIVNEYLRNEEKMQKLQSQLLQRK